MSTPLIQAWQPSEDDECAFRAGDETLEWLLDMPLDATREYAGKWIAAKDRRVIASAGSLDGLIDHLEGVDLQSVIIERVERPVWMVYR